jgi:hypothetical protein
MGEMIARILHIKDCINCLERFSTYERNDKYCDNCCYMETTQEWRERAEQQIEALLVR